MKKNLNLFLIALTVLLSESLNAQFHVNREYQTSGGTPGITSFTNPAGVDWTASIVDSNEDIVTTGHTTVSGQGENIYIRKVSSTGSILFQTNVNTSGLANDYGIAVTEDGSGNYYVVGATDNNGSNNYDAKIWKFNSSGTLINTLTYSGSWGLNDIATGVTIDASNNVYVCCSSESSASSYNYAVLKYSPSGTLQWGPTFYDYTSLVDVPVSISLDGTVLSVMGSSASSFTKSDMAVARFNSNTGAYTGVTRTNISGIGYDQVYNFKKDAFQNIYLVGKCSTNGVNYNMELVKIDPTYSIVWTRTVDVSGGEDVGTSVDIDLTGNVIMAGYTTKTSGIKQMSFYKYNPSGTLIYQYHQPSKNGTSDAYVAAIRTSTNGQTYFVAGETGKTGFKEVVVGRLSTIFDINWERSIATNSDFKPAGINLKSDGTINVTTLGGTGTGSYYTTQYSELEMTNNVISSNGKAICKENEIIVRFNRNAMNISAIDNTVGTKITEFGDLSTLLTSTANTQISASLNTLCPGGHCDLKAAKIFKNLPSTFTTTTSRLGTSVVVPDFWTALLLKLPGNMTIQQAMSAFNTIPGVVSYCHPNYIGQFHTPPPNDNLYAQDQQALHPDYYNTYPNAHINVEEAWNLIPSAGLPFIRAGVFDTGILWKHEDFGCINNNPATSKVKDGWDFETNTTMSSGIGEGFFTEHGSPVAGIIGAVRNNGLGIAGIAGGDAASGNNGVSLYSLRIGGSAFNVLGQPFFSLTLNYVADAIVSSAVNYSAAPYSYSLNVMNHAWGIQTTNPPMFTDTNMILITDAVHTANRCNVTFVASRGNDSLQIPTYPALTDDDWVLTVGGYGYDGYRMTPQNGEGFCGYGGLDVTGPAAFDLMFSTDSYNPVSYCGFGFTSGAAPHVTGVVSLLMSYMNDTLNPYKNLAPEDCEELIQRSATAPSSPNTPYYDAQNGFGKLNAGRAIRLVEKPYRDLKHFGTNGGASYIVNTPTLYSSAVTVTLAETFRDKNFPPNSYVKGKYVVDAYEITGTVFHNLPSTDTIKGYWPRSSGSSVFQLYSPSNILYPRERAIITSINNSSADLKGYVYKVSDTLGTFLGWWPCDTTFSCADWTSTFEYSVLTRNSVPAVGIDDLSSYKIIANIYPNPTNSRHSIIISSNKEETLAIDLYDLMGHKIKSVFSGKTRNGETLVDQDVSYLRNSMYIYSIKIGNEILTKKFVKQ